MLEKGIEVVVCVRIKGLLDVLVWFVLDNLIYILRFGAVGNRVIGQTN